MNKLRQHQKDIEFYRTVSTELQTFSLAQLDEELEAERVKLLHRCRRIQVLEHSPLMFKPMIRSIRNDYKQFLQNFEARSFQPVQNCEGQGMFD